MEYVGEHSLIAHLRDRHLDTSVHTVWLGHNVITFPIWNISGQLVGYQQYNPTASKLAKNNPREGRYFTRLPSGVVGVWGLESWSFSKTIFICEGIFDAAKITWLGYSAIAVLSYKVNPTTTSWLNILMQSRDTVAVCDNDASGIKLAKYGNRSVVVNPYHDLGDSPLEYVEQLCSKLNLH